MNASRIPAPDETAEEAIPERKFFGFLGRGLSIRTFVKRSWNRLTIFSPPEHNRLIIVRHGAVLGLGALIQAFPYNSPPPQWM
jgi:hypothetical protein